jgi:hypothetical protein
VPLYVKAIVPLVVTGLLPTVRNAGADNPTLVTVPVVVSVAQLGKPAATLSTWPVVPTVSFERVFMALA